MILRYLIIAFLLVQSSAHLCAQSYKALEGRWNMSIEFQGNEVPSWLEIKHSGHKTLIGRFVFAFGSARPIAQVKYQGTKFNFAIPPQWEPGNSDMEFQGELDGEGLKGTMKFTDGKVYNWTAQRSPELTYERFPDWGETIQLFNGEDLSGWTAEGNNQWKVRDGILKNTKKGANLVSERKFQNFKLHTEFRIPEGSNSGIYLRGRYEVQITDSYGNKPSDIEFSGIYGFLPPNEMTARPAGEWQSFDIILIGRRVTVIANGVPVIMDQVIPGMTGGAIDNNEAEAGPFLIQGDHGPIEFRSFEVTPAISN